MKGMSSATLRRPWPPYSVLGRPTMSPGISQRGCSDLGRGAGCGPGSAARPPSAGTLLTGRRPGKTTGSVCVGRSPRLILRGSFSADLIWTAASPINHGLMRTIHLPALAFNKTEEPWRPSRSSGFLTKAFLAVGSGIPLDIPCSRCLQGWGGKPSPAKSRWPPG